MKKILIYVFLTAVLFSTACGSDSNGSGGGSGGGAPISAVSDSNPQENAVAVNAPIGATVGITAFATPGDSSHSVTYSLTNNADGQFAIDATSGVVTVAAPLTSVSPSITVLASSSSGSSSSAIFSIAILPPAPEVTLEFPPARGAYLGSSINVRGTYTPENGLSITVAAGGEPITASLLGDATWKAADVPLVPNSDGIATIRVTATADPGSPTTLSSVLDTNMLFYRPLSFALDSDNNRVIVMDNTARTIVSVNIEDGRRTLISGWGRGSGPAFVGMTDVALDSANSRVLVLSPGAIFAVDLSTGDRTIISDSSHSGRIFGSPTSIEIDDVSNRAFVTEQVRGAIVEVNLISGDRSDLSSNALIGSGEDFAQPVDVVLDAANERLIVLNYHSQSLMEVDLATGNRKVISSNNVGTGANLYGELHITLDAENNRIFSTNVFGTVKTIDLANGNRSVFSIRGAELNSYGNSVAKIDSEHQRIFVMNSTVPAIASFDLVSGNGQYTVELGGKMALGSGDKFNGISGLTVDGANNRAIVANTDNENVVAVDLASGDRSTIAHVGPWLNINGISINPDNNHLVLSNRNPSSSLISIDPLDGQSTIVSSSDVGSGDIGLVWPDGIVIDNSNRALVPSGVAKTIIAVDLMTGARSLVSGVNGEVMVGAGPVFARPMGIDLYSVENTALVIDAEARALFSVDLANGNREILSSDEVGTGDSFKWPTDIVYDNKSDRALVLNVPGNAFPFISAVDLATGGREIVSNTTATQLIRDYVRMSYNENNNTAVVADWSLNALIVVDLDSGQEVVLSR